MRQRPHPVVLVLGCILAVLLGTSTGLLAQDDRDGVSLPPARLSLTGGVRIPIVYNGPLSAENPGLGISAEFWPKRIPFLTFRAGYDAQTFEVTTGSSTTLTLQSFSAGAGWRWSLTDWLTLRAIADAIATHADMTTQFTGERISELGVFGSLSLGARLTFLRWVTVDAMYDALRLYPAGGDNTGFTVGGGWVAAGVSIPFGRATVAPATEPTTAPPLKPRPQVSEEDAAAPSLASAATAGIEIAEVSIPPLFPVFFGYYDDHPVGTVTIRNNSSFEVSDIQVTFNVPQYMDLPKTSSGPETLAVNESAEVPIYAIFTDRVLTITEGTRVAGEITVRMEQPSGQAEVTTQQTIRFNDRNALTWDDDRKPAAFITAKDSNIQVLARTAAALADPAACPAIPPAVHTALAVYELFRELNLSYIADPASPLRASDGPAQVVDYLQFPRQTLAFKSGDCDDLSVLYCALLEAVGVESALVTVPGHIYAAVSCGQDRPSVRSQFSFPDEFIPLDGKIWVPVETTLFDGFVEAWSAGARQWWQYERSGQSELIPVREAWSEYEPVAPPADEPWNISFDGGTLGSSIRSSLTRVVDRQMMPKLTALSTRFADDAAEPRAQNALGILYARYGKYTEATARFERAVSQTDFVPALVNLGNIAVLQQRYVDAIRFLDRAFQARPDDPVLNLALARAHHALENYGTVRQHFDVVKAQDPMLAGRFAYLDYRGEEAARAADAADIEGVMVWAE